MNVNQLMNMVLRQVMRRAIGRGLNAGLNRMATGGKSAAETNSGDRRQAQAAKATAKRGRQALRIGRKIGRF